MKLSVFIFLMVFTLPSSVLSQDINLEKNIISLAFPSLLDKTLSLSYYRQLNSNISLVVNPRYRPVLFDPLFYWGSSLGEDNHFMRSRALIRSGVQFHKKGFFIEPLIQLDRGWARDVWDTEGDDGDYYFWDVDYTSIGMLLLCGIQFKKDENFFKLYVGAGWHKKYNTYTFKAHKFGEETYIYPTPRVDKSSYPILSLHLGLEAGHRF